MLKTKASQEWVRRNERGMNTMCYFIKALITLLIKIIHDLCLRFVKVNVKISVVPKLIYKLNKSPIISLSNILGVEIS